MAKQIPHISLNTLRYEKRCNMADDEGTGRLDKKDQDKVIDALRRVLQSVEVDAPPSLRKEE